MKKICGSLGLMALAVVLRFILITILQHGGDQDVIHICSSVILLMEQMEHGSE